MLLAAAVTWAAADGGARVGAVPVVAICAAVAFGLNWAVFVPSLLARTERYYDLTGSITYLTVVALALVLAPSSPTAVLLGVLVALWAARLGSFLFARIRRDGSDGRFDAFIGDPLRFAVTWTLQGLWVVLTAGAALAAMTARGDTGIGPLAVVGAVVWVLGFALEVAADRQKRAFRADPANAGRFITSGVWAWSRHPNYFGEITLWCGIALIALPALDGWQYVTLVSPVFVTVLLTRVSGIPLLERRSAKRWGDDPEYRRYVERTPVLVPRPPRDRTAPDPTATDP